MKTFGSERAGTGTAEWSEVNENICIGCPHNCLYCYAATNANWHGYRKRNDWTREALTKRADITSYPARDGVIMFPSTHDVTPFNLAAYIRVALLMLNKGNKLLIVSKPHLECVEKMCSKFACFKDQILFRFTIGSMNAGTCKFWEPGAPSPQERVNCLRVAQGVGYRTSVSIEPILGGIQHAMEVIESVFPYVTDTIWVGKMNKARSRVPAEFRPQVIAVETAQNDDAIMALVGTYEHDPKIKWKDSIKEVIERNRPVDNDSNK
jgi:DNA repair photolyase